MLAYKRAMNYIDNLGVDLSSCEIDFRVHQQEWNTYAKEWQPRLAHKVSVDVRQGRMTPSMLRQLKRKVGPFHEDGSPPYVNLVAEHTIAFPEADRYDEDEKIPGEMRIVFTIRDAFHCETTSVCRPVYVPDPDEGAPETQAESDFIEHAHDGEQVGE